MLIKSLEIKNFRGLENFQVAQLGRVNLIVGRNNSGKSSILEALRIYARNAERSVLEQIAASRDEKYRVNEADDNPAKSPLPFESFFPNRSFKKDDEQLIISIGEQHRPESLLKIKRGFLITEEETEIGSDGTRYQRHKLVEGELADSLARMHAEIHPALFISQGKADTTLFLDDKSPWRRQFEGKLFDGSIPCSVIPTTPIQASELAADWTNIGLTDDADLVKHALKLIEPDFRDLMFVERNEFLGDKSGKLGRIAIIRLASIPHPVSLSSMGDGMIRMLQIILKLVAAKGGMLLIDEFENGLHYSVQEKIWDLIFQLAQKFDLQVFATTHGWDCVESFAQVASQYDASESALFRVGKSVRTSDKGQTIATVFSGAQLFNLTQAEVDVR